jgi:hypothetical protein
VSRRSGSRPRTLKTKTAPDLVPEVYGRGGPGGADAAVGRPQPPLHLRTGNTDSVGGIALLYFAYNARISPDQMAAVAPGAEFRFIAHLPEWGLNFPIAATKWEGTLPTIEPEPGSTVWGAVYEIAESDLALIDALELTEQRSSTTIEAMDRNGKRHQVLVHLLDGSPRRNGNGTVEPSPEYLSLMVSGSRHWSLPFGWIASLEEHLENKT